MREELDINGSDIRRALLKNSVVKINGIDYTVIEELGRGASSLSYTVAGNGTTKVLVEFYPREVKSSVFESDEIHWIEDEIFQNYKQRFCESIATQQLFFNDVRTRNYTCEVEGPYLTNNTLYKLESSNAKSFDIKTGSIEDTISLLINYCKSLKKIHEMGWLAIDISTSNLYYAEDAKYIKHFDFDGFINTSDLQDKEVTIRYTAEFAPEEVIKGERRKINITSDYFCVAMILFHKICPSEKRPSFPHFGTKLPGEIELEDLITMVSNSDVFKGKYYDPFIYRKIGLWLYQLLEIRTNRIADEDKIISDLSEINDLLKSNLYFDSSKFTSNDECFVGRKKEIRQIEQTFSEGQKMVALHGVGGIGKSTIARRFAKLNEDKYDVIFCARFSYTTDSIFSEIYSNNANCGEKNLTMDDKRKAIVNYCKDKKVLLIVDSFDYPEKVKITDITEVNWNVILTSTNSSVDKYCKVIEIDNEPEEALELFKRYYMLTGGYEAEWDSECVNKLCETAEYNPLILEIFARYCGSNNISFMSMYKFIEKEINNSKSDNTLSIKKDDIDYYDLNPYRALRILFNLSLKNSKNEEVLSEKGKIFLFFLACCNVPTNNELVLYMIWKRHTAKTYEEFVFEYEGIIKKLQRLGWIKETSSKDGVLEYSMHRVAEMIVTNDLSDYMWKQQFAHCIEFLQNTIFEMMFITDEIGKIDEHQAQMYCGMIDNFKQKLELHKERFPEKLKRFYGYLLEIQRAKIEILQAHSKLYSIYYYNLVNGVQNGTIFDEFIDTLKKNDDFICIGLGLKTSAVENIQDYRTTNKWFWELTKAEQYELLENGLFDVEYVARNEKGRVWMKPIVTDHFYVQYLVKWDYSWGERVPWELKMIDLSIQKANLGYVQYQYYCALNMLYRESDVDKAIEYLKLAAKKGHHKAAYKLGEIYEKGELVVQDDTNAVCWYALADDALDAVERIEAIQRRNENFIFALTPY